MRYPRVYIFFESQTNIPDENFFQSISSSRRKVYLKGISKKIKSLEKSISVIKKFDYEHLDFPYRSDVLVLSSLSVLDFISTYFSDKNPRFYWIDSAKDETELEHCLISLADLMHMKFHLRECFYFYMKSRNNFENKCGVVTHEPERYLVDSYAAGHGETRTSLESEIRVHIKSLLSYGAINRIDLG